MRRESSDAKSGGMWWDNGTLPDASPARSIGRGNRGRLRAFREATLAAPVSIITSARSGQHHDGGVDPRRGAVPCPCGHQLPPLFEQISTSVGCLGLVLDRMCEGGLASLTRKIRALRRPVAERRTETVNGQVVSAHRGEHTKHRPVRERPAGPWRRGIAARLGESPAARR